MIKLTNVGGLGAPIMARKRKKKNNHMQNFEYKLAVNRKPLVKVEI